MNFVQILALEFVFVSLGGGFGGGGCCLGWLVMFFFFFLTWLVEFRPEVQNHQYVFFLMGASLMRFS